jgi:PAS domain S-box-containing protein
MASSNPNRGAKRRVDLESFFSLSTDLLCIAGFDGYFKRVNPAWERALGWSSAELTSRPWSDFVHPDDLASTIAEANRQTEQGRDAIEFENRYRTKGGSYLWLRWNSRPCPERGEMHAVARDVTAERERGAALLRLNASLEAQIAERTAVAEERASQAEIAQQELQRIAEQTRVGAERWRLFLQQLPLAVALIDDRLNYVFVSDRFREDFGLGPTSTLRHSDVFPEAAERWQDVVARSSAGERLENAEEEWLLHTGRKEWIRWRADPWRPQVGGVSGMVFYSEIITARKTAEEQIRRSSNDLMRSNAELEAFTYSVSHDLKEPLRTIEAFSQFLLEDYSASVDEQGREYLQKLAKASARMKRLIEDLLALSRIGRRDDPSASTDVASIVEGIVEGMRATIDDRSAMVRIEGELPYIFADTARLEQIFGNLIANAIKFNRSDRPQIIVGTRAQPQPSATVTFYVRDNGIGIDPSYHERVFGIFQRLHRREEFDGTGAGLAIVKRAVESLGGSISIESDGASGTTFVFTLPTGVTTTARAAA